MDAAVDQATADVVPLDSPPPPCDLQQPFGTPTLLEVVSSAGSDADTWFSDDQLTVYFRSTRGNGVGQEDIFVARRSTPTGALGTPVPVAGVSGTTYENGIAVSPDGLTIYFGSDRAGLHDIYVASRASVAGDFAGATLVTSVNSSQNDIPTFITADGTELYLSSNRNGTYKIYVAKRTSTSQPFDAPTLLSSISSTASESTFVMTRDGLTAYFSSTRDGGSDIFRATRSTTSDGFGTATKVTELNVAGSGTSPSWISPDGCTIVLNSNRPGGLGLTDTWVARKP